MTYNWQEEGEKQIVWVPAISNKNMNLVLKSRIFFLPIETAYVEDVENDPGFNNFLYFGLS